REIERSIDNTLRLGKVVRKQQIEIGGVAKNYLVTFEDGTTALFTPGRRAAQRNAAAHLLSDLLQLDAVPVASERAIDGITGSLQILPKGAVSAWDLKSLTGADFPPD